MKLTIIAFDSSWHFVYRTAIAMKKWSEIEIVNGYDESIHNKNVKIYSEYPCRKEQNREIVIASLNPKQREEEFSRWNQIGEDFATLIHPINYIDEDTKIHQGCVIGQGVVIYPDSEIKENVILMEYSSISHDIIVSEHSVIMEKVSVAGNATIGSKVKIEPCGAIKERVVIGSNACILMGSIVLKDLDNESIVSGNPARTIKMIKEK